MPLAPSYSFRIAQQGVTIIRNNFGPSQESIVEGLRHVESIYPVEVAPSNSSITSRVEIVVWSLNEA